MPKTMFALLDYVINFIKNAYHREGIPVSSMRLAVLTLNY